MPMVLASDIGRYVQEIYTDAMMIARDNNLMAALVTTFADRSGTAARSRSDYGTALISSITEVDDLASQAFTPSVANTLTPGEVGAQFLITDTRLESDPFGVRSDATLELGMAMAQSVEKNLLGTFSSLTGGTVGAAGTVITWGHFYAMLARLRNQNAPGPYVFVCHPYQYHQLGKAASVAGTQTNAAPELLNTVARRFFVQQAGEVSILTSSNISIDGSDDAYCAMFSAPAIALDWRRAPRIEPERDASRRGWELNLSALYAYGVWRPKFGIQGIFDATLPAS